jgi:hypothetical protein
MGAVRGQARVRCRLPGEREASHGQAISGRLRREPQTFDAGSGESGREENGQATATAGSGRRRLAARDAHPRGRATSCGAGGFNGSAAGLFFLGRPHAPPFRYLIFKGWPQGTQGRGIPRSCLQGATPATRFHPLQTTTTARPTPENPTRTIQSQLRSEFGQ